MDVRAFAQGYLDLIQAQDRGRGVGQATDYLQPIVSLEDLLLIARGQLFAMTDVAVLNTSTLITRVPQGELWRIKRGHIRWRAAAGGGITQGMVLISAQQPNWNNQRLAVSDPTSALAATSIWQRFTLDGLLGVWLPPGTEILTFAVEVTGAGNLADVALWYESLLV